MRGALPGQVVCQVLTRCPSTFDLASMASRRDATLPHAIDATRSHRAGVRSMRTPGSAGPTPKASRAAARSRRAARASRTSGSRKSAKRRAPRRARSSATRREGAATSSASTIGEASRASFPKKRSARTRTRSRASTRPPCGGRRRGPRDRSAARRLAMPTSCGASAWRASAGARRRRRGPNHYVLLLTFSQTPSARGKAAARAPRTATRRRSPFAERAIAPP